jgi:hypothetical protein
MAQRAQSKASTETLQKMGIVSRVAMTKGNVRRLRVLLSAGSSCTGGQVRLNKNQGD